MSIELGGKNPNIVFADADFEQAVDGALFGAFANQGEVCSAGSRLLVERTIYDRMLAALAEQGAAGAARRSAGARDQDGPAGHRRAPRQGAGLHRDRHARKGGWSPAAGARAGPALDKGNFVEPTIFADVDNRARIAQEEIFGPVLVVIPFDRRGRGDPHRQRHALRPGRRASGRATPCRGIRVLKQLRAGILWMNTYHPTYNEAPWGGYKQSGFGRELGPRGLEQYLETKQININLDGRAARLVLS